MVQAHEITYCAQNARWIIAGVLLSKVFRQGFQVFVDGVFKFLCQGGQPAVKGAS